LQRELVSYVQGTFDSAPDPLLRSYKTHIGETTYVCDSQKQGKTMLQAYPDHKVTQQYRELAGEIASRLDEVSTTGDNLLAVRRNQKEAVNG
jgi:nitrogenase subunit NifH